ncbi:hypothetical protein CerSpe_156950 [Prunus speciosa]
MDVHDQQRLKKSRVVRVNSEELWDFFITQAANQGCPVMVHFTAAWCMPSVAMNSFFEELAFNYHDRVKCQITPKLVSYFRFTPHFLLLEN